MDDSSSPVEQIKFNFSQYRKLLYNQLAERNKRESSIYADIIKDYKDLFAKYKSLLERNQILEREVGTSRKFSNEGVNQSFTNSEIKNLEKELSESLKESKVYSNKVVELLTDNMRLKDNNENLINQNSAKQNRITELESIIKNLEVSLSSLTKNEEYLKLNIAQVERDNYKLKEDLKQRIIENQLLVNQIMNIKEEYMSKMNEMIEMHEAAKKKMDAADIYFTDKKDVYDKTKTNIMDFKDIQVIVEDVKIPTKMKLKTMSHKKNITKIKFNNFGTGFITSGVDSFVKIWDANKSKIFGFY